MSLVFPVIKVLSSNSEYPVDVVHTVVVLISGFLGASQHTFPCFLPQD